MQIESIELKDFRNYEYLKTDFYEGVNLIYGDNAQGKTNILEAIYIAATTRSHRGARDEELIRVDDLCDEQAVFGNEKDAHIKLFVKKEYSTDRIDIHLKKNRPKGFAVNGVPLKRLSDIFGILQVIFFCPEDLDIIRRGPGVRRHFLDMDISRMNGIYLKSLIDYNKILDSRNKLLKSMAFKRKDSDGDTLDILDLQLVKYGSEGIDTRRDYTDKLKEKIKEIHGSLSGGKERLEIIYEPSAESAYFEEELKKSRQKDLRSGQTAAGPHRDDFTFLINGKDIRKFGSQGQKRTAALSLKLAEIDITASVTGEAPVLLLDDVFSELDRSRQEYLIGCIGDLQTFITCTGNDDILKTRIKVDGMFNVSNGKVTKET